MANNGSKVHIKHEQLEHGITVNVFGDTAGEAMELLIDTMAHLEGRIAADCVKAGYAQHRTPDRQPPHTPSPVAVNSPVCKQCGSSDNLDVVQFTNQDTDQPMSRYKCQTCKIWVGKAF